MRTTCTVLVVLVLLAAVSAQQVITDFAEYQRKKAEYEAQKAKYDEFQSLKNVPLLASYDLIPKVKDFDAPAGNAEQLLPTYTGIPVNFNEATGVGRVEAGNTPQNYFHTGPIPAKKSTPEPPPKPVVIPTGPGQDFVVPQSDDTAAVAAPAPAPAAPSGPDAASFAAPVPAPVSAPAPTPAPAPFAPAASGQALFFGQGALPVTTSIVQAAAPVRASFNAGAFGGVVGGASAVPLRPLGKEFQLGPYLPHSDFHPGPIRAVPVVPEHLRQDVIPQAPVPLFAKETFFAHEFPHVEAAAAAARTFGGQPARSYGPPGI